MSSVDSLQSSVLPHLLGADVGVAAGAVPVALHGFGIQGGHHPKVLTHAVQQEAGHPQVVAHLDAFAGADLELPLKKQQQRGTGNNSASVSSLSRQHPSLPLWLGLLF